MLTTTVADRNRSAVFYAHVLDREDTTFVLGDFHRIEDPRLMHEAQFEMAIN